MQNKPGAVVQLVRISACHAGGRGFKSRPHRLKEFQTELFFYLYTYNSTISCRYRQVLRSKNTNSITYHIIPTFSSIFALWNKNLTLLHWA